MRLLYADSSEDALEVDADGDLSDGQATLFPTDVPADGFTFDGTGSSSSYSGLPSFDVPVGGSGVASSSATIFRRDGTFFRQRSTAVNGNTSAVSYGFSNESASDGTYRIRGGELAMVERGTEGRVRRGEVVVLDDGDGPSLRRGTTRIELAPGQTIPRAGPPAQAQMPPLGASTDVALVPQSSSATNLLARFVNPLAAPVNPLASVAPTPVNPLFR